MIPSSSSSQTFLKVVAFSFLFFPLFFLFKHFSLYPNTTHNHHLSFFNSTRKSTPFSPPPPPLPPPSSVPTLPNPSYPAALERTGIINELGIMTNDFIVGEFDEGPIESVVVNINSSSVNGKSDGGIGKNIKFEKFIVCDESFGGYIPCLDNVDAISRFNSSDKSGTYERRCPKNGTELDCLLPSPKGYKLHLPWPKSRDKVWFTNAPHTRLVEDNKGHKWISRKGDKIILSGREPPYIHGLDQYLDQISKMVPEIEFGQRTRVALDIGSGIASFGAYLMKRNVTTLSIDLKNVRNNQIQIALERGVPAMVAAFGAFRLPYPSQAFDLIHCATCRINWTRDDGVLLLEANRILRAGRYFVWETQPVDKNDSNLEEQWKEMDDLTRNLCWNLVKKEGFITIWQKPINNSCYLSRDRDTKPSLCDTKDNPDDTWYVYVKACITHLPENGYGANVSNWPTRLHSPPDRLYTIPLDANKSRRELYKADTMFLKEMVNGYVSAFRINTMNVRNVMDMKARYGGFAAALVDSQVDCWVMNVVPVSGPNTLPVIYDRGLIGVMHDWCEPFDTYPRTYDWLNAAGLFSVEQKRCNITNIMVEMDRILRPGGRVYIRDITPIMDQLEQIAKAIGWKTYTFDSGEGPHSNWRLLTAEKQL